jgi:hypothetical protein
MQRIRLSVTVTPEQKERIAYFQKKMNISAAAIVSIALETGLQTLEMANNPEWRAFYEKQFLEGKIQFQEAKSENKQTGGGSSDKA